MDGIYAYCRFFPGDEKESQITAIREMQVPEKNIYTDSQKDKRGLYPQYQKLLGKLRPDDLLYIMSFEALGSSNKVIREQWMKLTKEKKVDVIVMQYPQLDTRRGKLRYSTLVADTVLSVLDYIVEYEDAVRKRCQRAGIETARQQNVRFGRPPIQLPDNFGKIYDQWTVNEITAREAAEQCHMSMGTFYKKVKDMREGRKL